ncbi:thioredoxin family protein [Planotetraspora sp. A-T 1434]|uniref:TlpA family protein disulfide reductase n=1 Tax=Planotetraspora sp. A-T 1434 TaxID=2979219 RepID=UPI0021BE3946|nr:thioredoxin family protein [Planotetraspora sp. A-T 1434]MCT9934756.1 thioredoxin family protein [Planotetraspora sp. A-T 1434]
MAGIVVLGVTLVVGVLIGLVMRRRDGRLRAVRQPDQASTDERARSAVTSGDIGADLGERATLVQFSTAFCQPCRATRRVLDEVAAMVPGVRHVEIDAESRLDLVKRFDVMRTPTVLILDHSGHIVKRASGQPRKVDVIAAIGAAVDGPSHESSH